MEDLFGPMFWFTCVVEDRNDPLQLGRVRARIVGYHTKDTTILPTSDLPWAIVLSSITSASVSGIGDAPVGPIEGSWCVGIFLDNSDNQEPLILGTLSGIPQSEYFASLKGTDGFVDASHTYPLKNLLDEPTTNRLARGISTGTIVPLKNAGRSTGIPTAIGGASWDEPKSAFNASYPKNHVFQSESGHTREYDDTPNFERTHEYHRAGTFEEIDKNGTVVRRIVGDSYEILDRNGFIYIKGKANLTVEGDVNIYVKNNCNIQVDGNMKTEVHGNYKLNVAGDIDITSGGKIQAKATDDVAIEGLNVDLTALLNLRGSANIAFAFKALSFYLEAQTIAAIKAATLGLAAPIMPQSILTINPPLAIVETVAAKALVGEYNTPSVDGPVGSKSPTEPNLPPLGFTLSPAQQQSFAIEKTKAFAQANDTLAPEDGRTAAAEYVALKSDELSTNSQVSAPVSTDPTATMDTPDKYACAAGLLVVAAATADLGILETGTLPGLNYGGQVGGGQLPVGVPGRIDEMLAQCGLDNKAQVKRTGTGFNWCAAAVTSWWKAAGLPTPSGSASCENWDEWANTNGYFSSTPKIGAAILYGTSGAAHHMGIVSSVGDDGTITTIEGNTTGSGFSSNGCTVASKTPRTYLGFVIPPPCSS